MATIKLEIESDEETVIREVSISETQYADIVKHFSRRIERRQIDGVDVSDAVHLADRVQAFFEQARATEAREADRERSEKRMQKKMEKEKMEMEVRDEVKAKSTPENLVK